MINDMWGEEAIQQYWKESCDPTLMFTALSSLDYDNLTVSVCLCVCLYCVCVCLCVCLYVCIVCLCVCLYCVCLFVYMCSVCFCVLCLSACYSYITSMSLISLLLHETEGEA